MDYGPSLIIAARAAVLYLNICARHYEWVDPALRHEDYSTSLLMIYVLMGFSLTADFMSFLLMLMMRYLSFSSFLLMMSDVIMTTKACSQIALLT